MQDCETNDCRKEKRGCKGCFYNVRKAKRIIYNKNYNDWNNELEYKLQNVRIHGEYKNTYIIDSGSKKFKCSKTKVFLDQEDFRNKIDNIHDIHLTEWEKEELLKTW